MQPCSLDRASLEQVLEPARRIAAEAPAESASKGANDDHPETHISILLVLTALDGDALDREWLATSIFAYVLPSRYLVGETDTAPMTGA